MNEYISKQKVLDYLNGYLHSLGEGGADTLLFDRGQRRALINSIQDILAVKAADVQPVIRGKWIKNDGDPWRTEYKCSECGADLNAGCAWNNHPEQCDKYCYNCGAKMDGEQK